jgi:hypothetical protein
MNLTRTLRRRTRRAPHDTAADPVPGPPDVEVGARHLRIGDNYTATLAVTGYPAEVAPGWLEPLRRTPAASTSPCTSTRSPGRCGGQAAPAAGPPGIRAPRRGGPRPAR